MRFSRIGAAILVVSFVMALAAWVSTGAAAPASAPPSSNLPETARATAASLRDGALGGTRA